MLLHADKNGMEMLNEHLKIIEIIKAHEMRRAELVQTHYREYTNLSPNNHVAQLILRSDQICQLLEMNRAALMEMADVMRNRKA